MKAILLTGGSAGIGLATAQLLMNKGYRVYSGSRRGGGEAQKSSSGGEIIPLIMDVNNEASIKVALDKILTENKELYAVISNAGNGIAGAVEECSTEEVKYQLETNFFGSVKVIQACLPVFRKQGHGKIIATTADICRSTCYGSKTLWHSVLHNSARRHKNRIYKCTQIYHSIRK
ncbi:MAG: short-chain dehydrogenase/reductase [Bacteroidetes bacterium]|nr:short-chain dehydrogenase/reductase [Bacteroidota bacterium]